MQAFPGFESQPLRHPDLSGIETGAVGGARQDRSARASDALADRAQDLGNLSAEKDESNNGNDRDQSEDKCIFRKSLACGEQSPGTQGDRDGLG